jgi:hypothetical protein
VLRGAGILGKGMVKLKQTLLIPSHILPACTWIVVACTYREELVIKQSSANRAPKHKHLLLDQAKIEKAQKALGARTETETIERALEIVIGEDEKNRRAWAATEKLVKNGIQIKDVFDHLNGK